MHKGLGPIVGWLRAWVALCVRRPRLVLALVTAVALAGLAHGIAFISIDTEARNMIDGDLRYRRVHQEYLEAFGQSRDSIAVIVRAETTETADEATRRLVEAMRARPDTFDTVFASAVEPYLRDNGLLFLSVTELEDLSGRLSDATPFLERLMADPTLTGLFKPMKGALERDFEPQVLIGLFDELSVTADAALADAGEAGGTARALSWARVFDPDGQITGQGPVMRVITANPRQDFRSLNPTKRVEATLDTLFDEVRGVVAGPVAFAVTGDAVLRGQELKSVSSGIGLSTVLSLVLVAVILAVGLRSWALVGGALLSLFLGLFLTFGFASVAVGSLNLVSIAFTVLFIGLGIDFAIHLALSFWDERRRGQPVDRSLDGAMNEIGLALVLCAPTTALTFYAFIPTAFTGIAQLGIISGTGVFIAFFTAVTVIPAWLALVNPSPRRLKRDPHPAFQRRFAKVTRPMALIALALGAVAIPWADDARFNADPMTLRDPDSPAVRAFQLLFEKDNTVPYTLQYLAGDLGAAQDKAELFERLPAVRQALTLASFVPKDQSFKMTELDYLAGQLAIAFQTEPEPTTDPDSHRAAIADFIAAGRVMLDGKRAEAEPSLLRPGPFEASLSRLIDRMARMVAADDATLARFEALVMRHLDDHLGLLERQVAVAPVGLDDVPQTLRRLYMTDDGRARVQIYPRYNVAEEAGRARFVDEVVAVEENVTGSAKTVLYAARYVSEAMVQATATAAVVAAAILWIALRRLTTVALILLPLVLAGILTMAASTLLGMPFNFANVIVLPLLIGLGVDSGIHFVLRARAGGGPLSAVATSTPRAVSLSALTTIGSFGTLALNDHRGTASMGILLTIAIGLTLVCTLVVLPGLWSLRHRLGDTNDR
ncbi:MMPL family transporter [Rhodothalassium salexigens]|uniref:MMPL family transporter n=1 Tax=Rhodothalassium salexigens TaxID=1086 RepID=UPI001911A758|nr:MMPL family transporter [Rhodothalassium salexigens]